MKRLMMTIAAMVMTTMAVMAMSYEQAREQAYYLTDKMAYELNLNDQQYNDAYEINLDYLLSLNTVDDVYGTYLTYRNNDLRFILHDWQWNLFYATDYFFRPVSWIGGAWYFPIYRHYAHHFWYYSRPSIFWDYRGAHCHTHYVHTSYYSNRRPGWSGGMRGAERHMVGREQMHNGQRIGHDRVQNNRNMGVRHEGNMGTRSDRTNIDRTGSSRESMRGSSINSRTQGESMRSNRESFRNSNTGSRTQSETMRPTQQTMRSSSRGISSSMSRSTSSFSHTAPSMSTSSSRSSMSSHSTGSSFSSGASRGMGGSGARGGRR